jgi:hypothetical protein
VTFDSDANAGKEECGWRSGSLHCGNRKSSSAPRRLRFI